MAKLWKCARCSTENAEGVVTCSNCRMIRGGVVVPGSFSQPAASPVPGWPRGPTPQPRPAWEPATEFGEVSAGAPDPAGIASRDEAPRSSGLSLRKPVLWVVVALTAVAVGLGMLASQTRSSNGEITRSVELSADDLRVGDCFDIKDPTADLVDRVTAQPCTRSHQYELFYVGRLQGTSYPSDGEWDALFDANCPEPFGTYVGTPYADSELEIFWLGPDKQGWFAGDRSIQCSVFDPKNKRLTKSLKAPEQ